MPTLAVSNLWIKLRQKSNKSSKRTIFTRSNFLGRTRIKWFERGQNSRGSLSNQKPMVDGSSQIMMKKDRFSIFHALLLIMRRLIRTRSSKTFTRLSIYSSNSNRNISTTSFGKMTFASHSIPSLGIWREKLTLWFSAMMISLGFSWDILKGLMIFWMNWLHMLLQFSKKRWKKIWFSRS